MKEEDKVYNLEILVDGEKFKEIPGFPNYFVSASGKVFSLKIRHLLQPFEIKSGYLLVKLRNGTQKPKNCYIHRLVAESWVPNLEKHPIIHHADGDALNNNYDNLVWVSAEEHKSSVPFWGKPRKKVLYEGVVYNSIKDLADSVGKVERTVYKWIDNGKVVEL